MPPNFSRSTHVFLQDGRARLAAPWGLVERSRPDDSVVLLLASGSEPEGLSGTVNSGGIFLLTTSPFPWLGQASLLTRRPNTQYSTAVLYNSHEAHMVIQVYLETDPNQ